MGRCSSVIYMPRKVTTRNENRPVVYAFPEDIKEIAISVDEFWSVCASAPKGWHAGKIDRHPEEEEGVKGHVFRCMELTERPEIIPEFLQQLRQRYAEVSTLSCFTSAGVEGADATLPWHVDGYDVFAFNMEGETVWEYFCQHEGKVKSIELGEMDKLLYMPCGLTHRVVLKSESRTSVSIVAPGRCNGVPCKWEF